MTENISLDGRELIYSYPQLGMKFHFIIGGKEFTFQRTQNDDVVSFPAMEYKAIELRDKEYIFAFHMPNETFVTLIIDAKKGVIYNSMVWGPEVRDDMGWVWGIEEGVIESF